MTRTSAIRLVSWSSGARAAALVLMTLAVSAEDADAYSINGEIIAYASPGGDVINRTTSGGAATVLSDSDISYGTGGASAEAAYFANLATGRLGTYLRGNSPNAAIYEGGGASLESSVLFNDILTFMIPAGNYAQDLSVSLRGFVNGSLAAAGCDSPAATRCSNVYETYRFAIGGGLGGDVFSADSNDTHTYPEDSPRIVDERFTLSAKILSAGDYALAQTRNLIVNASLKGKGGALWLYPSTGDDSSSVIADFYTTGGFTAIDAPAGVTWSSESGVFLSAVPVPPAVVFLASGAALCWRRRRRLHTTSARKDDTGIEN